MLRAGFAVAAEERLQAELEVAHFHSGSHARLPVPGRRAPSWPGTVPSSPARQGHRPQLHVLHAKSSPALASRFIACKTPARTALSRPISIARHVCTQQTAYPYSRRPGHGRCSSENRQNRLSQPALACSFTRMGLPTLRGSFVYRGSRFIEVGHSAVAWLDARKNEVM